MTPTTELSTETLACTPPMPSQPASVSDLFRVSLLILLPGAVATLWILPLPVRGVSAILCGLAVLLGGPYLFSHALMRWARRVVINPS